MPVEEVYQRPDDYELETLGHEIGDLRFWQELLQRERPRRVLEIGSGCGRLTLPLARQGATQGFSVIGLEMEPAMLARAQEHARDEPETTQRALRLAQGDARDLDGALRRQGAADGAEVHVFDVILASFGVAHHLITPDDQLSAWCGARRWLRTGGLLAVDVMAPDLSRLLAGQEAQTPRHPDLEVSRDGRALRRTLATRYYAVLQQETLSYEYHITERDGTRRDYRSDFASYVYFPRELALLFRATGFTLEQLVGSYSGDPYDAHSRQLIGLGRAV